MYISCLKGCINPSQLKYVSLDYITWGMFRKGKITYLQRLLNHKLPKYTFLIALLLRPSQAKLLTTLNSTSMTPLTTSSTDSLPKQN